METINVNFNGGLVESLKNFELDKEKSIIIGAYFRQGAKVFNHVLKFSGVDELNFDPLELITKLVTQKLSSIMEAQDDPIYRVLDFSKPLTIDIFKLVNGQAVQSGISFSNTLSFVKGMKHKEIYFMFEVLKGINLISPIEAYQKFKIENDVKIRQAVASQSEYKRLNSANNKIDKYEKSEYFENEYPHLIEIFEDDNKSLQYRIDQLGGKAKAMVNLGLQSKDASVLMQFEDDVKILNTYIRKLKSELKKQQKIEEERLAKKGRKEKILEPAK